VVQLRIDTRSDRRNGRPTVDGDRSFRALLSSRARTFAFAARFLPERRREGVVALYAFCRVMDDLADEYPVDVGVPALASWELWLRGLERGEDPGEVPALPGRGEAGADALTVALRGVIERYAVPPRYLRELVQGLREDATRAAVRDFAELRRYCYLVAGTVGRALCSVLGATSAEALQYAERLGIAMQLTNVLRDVGEDLERGRIYLPADELARFGVDADDLRDSAGRRVTPQFHALMRFQIGRARAYYAAGMPGVFLLPPESRLSILLASRLYGAILDRIEAAGYDVFTRRAATSAGEKVYTAAVSSAALWAANRFIWPRVPADREVAVQ
jgi:phytoene synthase